MEEDSAVVRGLDTLTICLQQSWANISQSFPQIGTGKTEGERVQSQTEEEALETQSPAKFCTDFHN